MKNFGAISEGKDLPIKKYADDRVIANPTLAGTEDDLTSIQIAGVKYKIPEGGAVGGNATAGDILYPKTAVVNGSLITGSIQVEQQTVTPTTSAQTVTPTSGNLLDEVTVNAIPNNYVDTSSGDAVAGDIRAGKNAWVDGVEVTGGVTERDSTDLTASGDTVTVPAGIYDTAATKAVAEGVVKVPSSISGDDAALTSGTDTLIVKKTISVTPEVTTEGYVTEGTARNVKVTLRANVNTRDSTDLTVNGLTVTAPAGFYKYDAEKTVAVAQGSAATPNTTITVTPSFNFFVNDGLVAAIVRNEQTSITPTVTEGYVTEGTAGTVTVTGESVYQIPTQAAQTIHPSTSDQTVASRKYLTGVQTIKGVLLTNLTAANIKKDVVVKVGDSTDDDCVTSITGTYEGGATGGDAAAGDLRNGKTAVVNGVLITGNVTERDSTDLSASGATVTVPAGIYDTAATKTVAAGSVTAPSTISGSSATVTAGTNTLTLEKTVSVTPNVTSAGYISSGTAGNATVTLTASVNTRSSSDLTASGATVTAPAGYYGSAATKSVASGSAATPATTVTANPSISVSSGGLITATASATQSVTPTVSAGYVSSGTAGTITVSGSNTSQLTTQAATTYTPTTTDQTIASGTYLTGTQTIEGDANLVAGNIKKDVSIFGVTGTYEGSSATEPYVEETYDSSGNLTAAVLHGHTVIRKYMFARSNLTTMEIAPAKLDSLAFYYCSTLEKVWFRSTCTTVVAASASASPFNGCPTSLKIYCEASSKPSGYSTYFNRTGTNGGTTVSVVYNRTTRPW